MCYIREGRKEGRKEGRMERRKEGARSDQIRSDQTMYDMTNIVDVRLGIGKTWDGERERHTHKHARTAS